MGRRRRPSQPPALVAPGALPLVVLVAYLVAPAEGYTLSAPTTLMRMASPSLAINERQALRNKAGLGSAIRTSDVLSLESIRGSLIRQEETIIFALIERAQFRQNSCIYTDPAFRLHKADATIPDRDASFLEYMLCETEKLHAKVRRYMSPEELAFFPNYLPPPILPPLDFPPILPPNDVNMNAQILRRYTTEVVRDICEEGDDEQHGSSVICDINVLQALSRRVHFGKFVAESKFQESGDKYRQLCRAADVRGVNALLTNKAVEAKVIERAFKKASTYGSDVEGEEEDHKVEPSKISQLYRDLIIPLTKDAEILYLFQRTGYPCPALHGVHDEE